MVQNSAPIQSEIVDGLHRIAFANEQEKLFAYHIIETERGLVLFDTGMKDTPDTKIAPYLEERGWELTDIHMAIITHADADHCGGNDPLLEQVGDVLFLAHEEDRLMVEKKETIMEHRYNQFSDRGVRYPETIQNALKSMMEMSTVVDLGLSGGESIRWKNGRFRAIHAPGHTDGSLVFYDLEQDMMIGGDAVYPEAAWSLSGEKLQPPPYVNLEDYVNTIQQIRELDPSVLLLSHFPPLEDQAVSKFLDRAEEWIRSFDDLLHTILQSAEKPLSLRDLIETVVDERGDFGMNLDLAFPISAHLEEMEVRVEMSNDNIPHYIMRNDT